MRGLSVAGLFVSTMLIASGARAQSADRPCAAPFQKLVAADVFGQYRVAGTHRKRNPVPPRVESGTAHLYRTVLREEARAGPNFAGHYTIARIGCGAATVCIAIIDAISGKVHFPANLKSATALMTDTGRIDVKTLNYRLDSRLLVVFGSPNEDEKREGMSYYVWESRKLKPIDFVPTADLCRRQ